MKKAGKLDVSILVFVELALGPNFEIPLEHYICVSILVFVELALGHLPEQALQLDDVGFNPCFRGTCPRTSPF